MSRDERIPSIDKDEWTSTPQDIVKELKIYAQEFDSFTPEHFAELNFHLLRRPGLTKNTRNEFCELSIYCKTCPKCELLYVAKKCPLWYRLYRLITWDIVKRAPPCIRLAFAKKTIRTVTNYLVGVNLVAPPFFKTRGTPSCNALRSWGYCTPNEYCKEMKTENTREYNAARERVKISRKHS